jgi:hypothetical protein
MCTPLGEKPPDVYMRRQYRQYRYWAYLPHKVVQLYGKDTLG